MQVSIDFETRNRVSIKAGVYQYARSAEILCMSYSIDGGPIRTWQPGQERPADLVDAIYIGADFRAYNAAFERIIWDEVMAPKLDWPEVENERWFCTMAEALACGLPAALEHSADTLNLGIKKDMTGSRLMKQMTKPRKPTKKNPAIWHDTPEKRARLVEYCEQDVRTEQAVCCQIDPLTPRERQIYLYDQLVNDRGVKIDREMVESAIAVWGQYSKTLNDELSEITFGEIGSASEVQKTIEFLASAGVVLPTLDAKTVEDALKGEIKSKTARRVLEIRRDLSKSSVKKYQRMLMCAGPDDRIRGCFQYHGAAQTGRWAGRLVQLQNLPRGGLKPEQIDGIVESIKSRSVDEVTKHGTVGDVLSSMIRSAIVAEEGKKLLVCDFAAIEARCLAWMAGEKWLLDAFASGRDVYVEMAATIYGIPVEEVTKDQRWYGKTVILGSGYGLGAQGFQRTLESFGVQQDMEFCKKVIDTYRGKNKRIKAFWYGIEEAAVRCVRDSKDTIHGPIRFTMKGDWLCMKLPTGRLIRYYKPVLIDGAFGKQIQFTGPDQTTGKPVKKTTYGGKLTENASQAICRDLLVEAMSRLERAGYVVVAHVHDEVVSEVDESFGSIEEMEQIMSEVPEWARGFPINTEGFECRRYRK